MDIAFTSSDIWLLLSVALAETEPPVTLVDVIAAGHAINKAVFTPQELRRGFSKLTRAGYAVDDAGAYSLTPAGREIVDRARKAAPKWLEMWRKLEVELGATRGTESDPRYEDVRFPYPQLTNEVVAEAVRHYTCRGT